MNEKVISLVLVACASLAALFFVVKQNTDLAILCLTIMFTLTNFFRARSFAEQGMEKESKWMKKMSIFFAIASVIVLYIIVS